MILSHPLLEPAPPCLDSVPRLEASHAHAREPSTVGRECSHIEPSAARKRPLACPDNVPRLEASRAPALEPSTVGCEDSHIRSHPPQEPSHAHAPTAFRASQRTLAPRGGVPRFIASARTTRQRSALRSEPRACPGAIHRGCEDSHARSHPPREPSHSHDPTAFRASQRALAPCGCSAHGNKPRTCRRGNLPFNAGRTRPRGNPPWQFALRRKRRNRPH